MRTMLCQQHNNVPLEHVTQILVVHDIYAERPDYKLTTQKSTANGRGTPTKRIGSALNLTLVQQHACTR